MEQNRPYKRKDRVQSLIKKELGMLLLREINFEGSFASITNVVVTKRLDYARVYVSVIPSQAGEEVVRHLNARQPHLQRELLRKISIKPMPRLEFILDHGPEKAAKIEKALLDTADRA